MLKRVDFILVSILVDLSNELLSAPASWKVSCLQAVLKKIGSCSSGYAWKAKAGGGYRCSAGGHTITQQQLDAHM